MNILLFGIKGCGKTTFGKQIAKKLGRAFIDTDYLIEDLYQMHRGHRVPCREIFLEVGPAGFRALEYEVIQSLQDVQNSVIAVGGGAMVMIENVEALSKSSHMFYLVFEKEPLKKRVLSADELPVFLDPNDPDSSFDRMYDERDEYYRKLGATEINVTEMKDADVVGTICDLFDEAVRKKGNRGK
ncbi:shikimate kinase [Simkania sp.]|uniref:shikimate kinase n=1 Tax=Simkania sp. TaxID=34094 RepID=UPI003B52DE98